MGSLPSQMEGEGSSPFFKEDDIFKRKGEGKGKGEC